MSLHRSNRLGDVSGAFADLGTFLPLVIGILAVPGYDAVGILIGFGIVAVLTAALYRLPIPVQPMKAVAALIIVGALTPAETAATGLIIGTVLIVLAFTGAISWLARVVPASVILGVQMAVGAHLVIIGIGHVAEKPWFGAAALAALAVLYFTRFWSFAAILVVAAAAAVALTLSPSPIHLSPVGLHWPAPVWPEWADFERAAIVAVLPQMAMTLSNAVLVTATLAGDYFPDRKHLASAPRLAAGTGVFNILTAPFGAIPMCHGAGGLVAQVGFGARTWLAPLIFGGSCLVLGILFGSGAREILGVVSIGAVGALLVFAGGEMLLNKRFLAIGPGCQAVVLITIVACVATNMAAGLAIGLVAEVARTFLGRRSGTRPAA